MIVPVWACDLAKRFWERAGLPRPFPRDLAPAIESAFDVTIKALPNLTVAAVRAWLATLGIATEDAADRPLRGCLSTSGEAAFLFVDANDPPEDLRFTLAHELAHYLRDLRRPRDRVVRNLGPDALQVVDGQRPASVEERFGAALVGIDLRTKLHLFLRDPSVRSDTIADAEDAADRLAYELLAPASHLADSGAERWSDAELCARLVADYGLPLTEAERYASLLRPKPTPTSTWLVALGAELRKERQP